MRSTTLAEELRRYAGKSVVVHPAAALPEPLRAFPPATAGVGADVAIGLVERQDLRTLLASLRGAVRHGGVVFLVVRADGPLGKMLPWGRNKPLELSELSETLLEEGLIELGAAGASGVFRRFLFAWGEVPSA